MQARMARYDVRNDGSGPYAVFYCDKCDREFRAQPSTGGPVPPVAQDLAKKALGGLFGSVPVVGGVLNAQSGPDQRYVMTLTTDQLNTAWAHMSGVFHECPACQQLVCPTDWDAPSGHCKEDSPRSQEIAQAQAQQAAATLKGFADAFGFGNKIAAAQQAAQKAEVKPCVSCGTDTRGAKFCPNCGTPVAQASGRCGSCGADTKGAKFCPECGAKQG